VSGSSLGSCDKSTGRPRWVVKVIVSCNTAIMPKPRRSTLMMPKPSQSSLSHWATTRPAMEAFSSGTIPVSSPWHRIMPPEC
jgi:hypothetical protein